MRRLALNVPAAAMCLVLGGCTDKQALETGDSPKESSNGETADDSTGTTDSVESAETSESSETAHTGESGESGESGETADTGKPPPLVLLDLPSISAHNLVFIHVDTLRSDHMPFYGYSRDTMPLLQAYPWIVVSGVVPGSSWTVPSTASLLTGLPPQLHGVTTISRDGSDETLTMLAPSFAEHLASLGFATADFTGNVWIGGDSELRKGFATNAYIPKNATRYNSGMLAEAAMSWLATVKSPFFAFLQPMDMHDTYWVADQDLGVFGSTEPPFPLGGDWGAQHTAIVDGMASDPAGTTQALIDVYDEQMLGLDRSIDAFIQALSAAGLLEDTVIVLSADHGETMNDLGDGYFGHGDTLRHELLTNPLLILAPGLDAAELDCLAENEDTLPTLLDAMGIAPMPDIDGHSLRDGCRTLARSSLYRPDTIGQILATNAATTVIRNCEDGSEQAYDLVADPGTLNPLAADTLPDAAAFQAELDAFAADIYAALGGDVCVGG